MNRYERETGASRCPAERHNRRSCLPTNRANRGNVARQLTMAGASGWWRVQAARALGHDDALIRSWAWQCVHNAEHYLQNVPELPS